MALHLALSIQKCYQGTAKGKNRKINLTGHCVLVFDNELRDQKRFTDLLLNAPDWTNDYYDKKPNQEIFSQIVDVPHFVDSKDVGLIQLSDFICFFLRRYLELKAGCVEPDYEGEIENISAWVKLILEQSIPKSNIFLKKGRSDCADLFYRYAPEIIR